MKDKDKCTLTNQELVVACNNWVSKLAKTGGEAWSLQVPINFNQDPDVLINELGNRLMEQANEDKQSIDELVSALEKARRLTEYMTVSTEREIIEMRFDKLIQKHRNNGS